MGKGPSSDTQNTQQQLTTEQTQLAEEQNQRASKLFNIALPGYKTAESFYQKLASGNPTVMAQALAPAQGAISQNTAATKANILANTPRGGVQDLAIDQADMQAGAERGNLTSNAFLSAFPALTNLSGQAGGLSVNTVANAIASFSGASSSNQALSQEQQARKESTMGFVGGLIGDAATIAAAPATGGGSIAAAGLGK